MTYKIIYYSSVFSNGHTLPSDHSKEESEVPAAIAYLATFTINKIKVEDNDTGRVVWEDIAPFKTPFTPFGPKTIEPKKSVLEI